MTLLVIDICNTHKMIGQLLPPEQACIIINLGFPLIAGKWAGERSFLILARLTG